MTRPFARLFDLISKEYGWTDDDILDLTVGRLVQIRDVVRERLSEQADEMADRVERQTNALMQQMAAVMGGDPGKLKYWRMYPKPKKGTENLPDYSRVSKMFGADTRGQIDWSVVERMAAETKG